MRPNIGVFKIALGIFVVYLSAWADSEKDLRAGTYADGRGNYFQIEERADELLFRTGQLPSIGRGAGTWVPLVKDKQNTSRWLATQDLGDWGHAGQVKYELREENGKLFLSEQWVTDLSSKERIDYSKPFVIRGGDDEGDPKPSKDKSESFPPEDANLSPLPDGTLVQKLHHKAVIIPTRDITFPAEGSIKHSKIAFEATYYASHYYMYRYRFTFLNPTSNDRPHVLRKGRRLWVTRVNDDGFPVAVYLETNNGQRFRLTYSTDSYSFHGSGWAIRWLNDVAGNLFWFGELAPEEIPEK